MSVQRCEEGIGLELAEARGERDLIVGTQALIPEEHHLMLEPGAVKLGERRIVERSQDRCNGELFLAALQVLGEGRFADTHDRRRILQHPGLPHSRSARNRSGSTQCPARARRRPDLANPKV